MQKSNQELMSSARQALGDKWKTAVVITLVYFLTQAVLSLIPRLGPLANLIVNGPMSLGYLQVMLKISRGDDPKVPQIFDGFSRFIDALVATVLIFIFVILWSLLLIVPGIIAMLSYSMTYFIMADDRSLDGATAIRMSKQLMDGHKTRLFMLSLRFIGWFIVGILSFGIGFIWIMPYVTVTLAEFYEGIRVRTLASS